MAENPNQAAEAARRQALESERRSLASAERSAKRQESIRKAQLAALKRTQKYSGKAAEMAGGEAAGRGAQAATFVAGLPVRAAGMAASPFTFGATGAATTAGATAAGQAAYQAGKRTARPIAKQAGKAPFRPAIGLQKRRVKAAQRTGAQARAARGEVDQELARGEGVADKAFRIVSWPLRKGVEKAVFLPLEIVVGLIGAFLAPIILLLLLMAYVVFMVIPFYSPGT